MRVQVDTDRREANGLCVMAAPEVFDLDDAGQLHYRSEPGDELRQDVEDAARSCPVRAITIRRSPPSRAAVAMGDRLVQLDDRTSTRFIATGARPRADLEVLMRGAASPPTGPFVLRFCRTIPASRHPSFARQIHPTRTE